MYLFSHYLPTVCIGQVTSNIFMFDILIFVDDGNNKAVLLYSALNNWNGK